MIGEAASKVEGWERRRNRLRHWHLACAERSNVITEYNLTEVGTPLFFFHGDWEGGGRYVRRVASQSGLPIIAVAPHGMHGDPIPKTIEEMAAERLQLLLSMRPKGPYRLGGFCNGALVAYELARRLTAAGHEVELIVLVEPPSLNARPAFAAIYRALAALVGRMSGTAEQRRERLGRAMNVIWQASRFWGLSVSDAISLISGGVTRRWRAKTENPRAAGSVEQKVAHRNALLEAIYDRACVIYLPKPTHTPVAVLANGRDAGDLFSISYDGRSWKHICSNFVYIPLPGNHMSCRTDHVDNFADQLAAVSSGVGWRNAPRRVAVRDPKGAVTDCAR